MIELHIEKWLDSVHALGNADIIKKRKTAFLCSRRYPAKVVLRIYDWAKEMRTSGECVMSGFHSPLEKDVLEILLRGTQPVILAAARGLPKRLSSSLREALDQQRLLIISPFPDTVTRVTVRTAHKRNQFMLSTADRIVIGYATPDGNIESAIQMIKPSQKVLKL